MFVDLLVNSFNMYLYNSGFVHTLSSPILCAARSIPMYAQKRGPPQIYPLHMSAKYIAHASGCSSRYSKKPKSSSNLTYFSPASLIAVSAAPDASAEFIGTDVHHINFLYNAFIIQKKCLSNFYSV